MRVRCFGLILGVFGGLTLSVSLAAATHKLNLQIMNTDGGPLSTCNAASSEMRFKFRITNNDSVPVDLNTLQVTAWTNDASVAFSNQDWTNINGGAPFQMANHTETTVASCGVSPRLATRRLVQTFGTSAPIPAGGYAQGEIFYWRGGLTPFDVGCDDYSKTNWTDSLWHDDQYFTLKESGAQVCEYTNSTTMDPNSGMDPCTGGACATPTFTPSPTRTVTPTVTPQMSLVKSANAATVSLGDTLTFCIAWINDSNAPTTRVIHDVVPPAMTFIGADSGGALGGGTVTWSFAVAAHSNGSVCFWGEVTSVP